MNIALCHIIPVWRIKMIFNRMWHEECKSLFLANKISYWRSLKVLYKVEVNEHLYECTIVVECVRALTVSRSSFEVFEYNMLCLRVYTAFTGLFLQLIKSNWKKIFILIFLYKVKAIYNSMNCVWVDPLGCYLRIRIVNIVRDQAN